MINLNTPFFNQYRVQDPLMPSTWLGDETCGLFLMPSPIKDRHLIIRASAYSDWDHLSVSVKRRSHLVAPVWPEMTYVKDTFLGPDTWAIQYHPPVDVNVSYAEVLHIWRPWNEAIPIPPIEMV